MASRKGRRTVILVIGGRSKIGAALMVPRACASDYWFE